MMVFMTGIYPELKKMRVNKIMKNNIIVSRKAQLLEKVVIIDGLPGCGKTLFSPIVATLDRVELLNFAYELEHTCALHHLGKMPLDAARTMIKLQTDMKIYNTMMGREVNFRPTDQSSAIQDHNPSRYFQRLFQPGDQAIPDIIRQDKPILNLTTHQLLGFSEPIWKGLGDRCVFIEIVRHPLYMFRQQLNNEKNLFGKERDFNLTYLYDGKQVPFYTFGWEREYLDSNESEMVIHYFNHLTRRTENAKKNIKNGAIVITIPFEKFVLDPESWIEKISHALGTEVTNSTKIAMQKQNVPRDKISQSIDTPLYRRCGWKPPIEGASERDELMLRRYEVKQNVSHEAMRILDNLCHSYEEKYWNPDSL